MLKSANEAAELIRRNGFLPLMNSGLGNYSLFGLGDPLFELDFDSQASPWFWRTLLAADPDIAYGKFFRGKAGFVSREWFPAFANYRRDGYDWDTLHEMGMMPRCGERVMPLFADGACMPPFAIAALAGLSTKPEALLTQLQARCYLIIDHFERRRSRTGEEYGWNVSYYVSPEAKFGYDEVRSAYAEQPEQSLDRIVRHLQDSLQEATGDEIRRFLKP